MRFRRIASILLCLMLSVFVTTVATAQTTPQDVPDQIQFALEDLSTQLGTQVTLNDLDAYTFQGRAFNDASLGCPQPDQSYAEVVTEGYQFTLTYQGNVYDYRVSDDGATVIQCSVNESPAQPVMTATATTTSPVTPEPDEEQPIVAAAPLIGATGTTVDIIANRFPANQNVRIGIGPVESEYDVVQTTRTNAQGVVVAQVIIPSYFNVNDEVVIVVETEDFQTQAITDVFTVTEGDGDDGDDGDTGTGNPQVMLSSQSGAPGSQIQMTATGFPANANVLVGFGPVQSEFIYSLNAITDAQGNLSLTLRVPETVQPGGQYVVLVELESDRQYEAISDVFIPTEPGAVTETPFPTATPEETAEFTSANIYLISTDDGGPVGCGDTVVPVQVNFAPTIAPLTSALGQLFAIGTQDYGQSGLYNALYQSNLAVQGIDIENGHATINLTGNVLVGGTCDVPRFEEQIRQTALQFSTISSVDIFVDGVPLSQALQ